MFDHLPLVLAQDAAPQGVSSGPSSTGQTGATSSGTTAPNSTGKTSDGGGGFGSMMPILLVGMIIMIIFTMTGGRKDKKKREAMLAALKKGDKVQTVGGAIGTVVEVRDTEVVLKVDENTNTRIKYTRAAIQAIIEDKAETPAAT